jgi:transcriptional regulator with XRE-family HTH domain
MNGTCSTQTPRLGPLARLRILKGLTQEQLAAAVGVDRGELSRIERGLRPLSFARRASIAQALGYTPDELYGQLKELAGA